MAKTISSTIEISTDQGRTFVAYPIEFAVTISPATDEDRADATAPGAEMGWINGTVTVGDRRIAVGGGWINTDGSVEPYQYSEIGDLGDLMTAVGLDEDVDEDRTAVMYTLRRAVPRSIDVEA